MRRLAVNSYQELAPHPALAGRVACVWRQTIGDAPTVHRVVPDACADIIAIDGGPPMVVGPATGTVLVPLPARTQIAGVRFLPGAVPALLGVPASALLDVEVPLEEVWGAAASRALQARLEDAARGGPRSRLAVFEACLLGRRDRWAETDRLVISAVAWLARHPARHVHELARTFGISERQLLRRFRAEVGYAPKVLHRVLRFQRLLVTAHRAQARLAPARTLAGLATEAGYLDQAHMAREVATLAGERSVPLLAAVAATPPTAMSEFFKTVDRG